MHSTTGWNFLCFKCFCVVPEQRKPNWSRHSWDRTKSWSPILLSRAQPESVPRHKQKASELLHFRALYLRNSLKTAARSSAGYWGTDDQRIPVNLSLPLLVVSGSWRAGQVWSYTNFLLVLTCIIVPALRGLKSYAGIQNLPSLSCYFTCLLRIR